MYRSTRLLAVAIVVSLLGSSVAWAVALKVAPLGAYDVELHLDEGRLAIVLDRRAPADRSPSQGDPAMNDSDGLHDEFVVTLATLDAFSTSDPGKSLNVCASAIVIDHTIDLLHLVAPARSVATVRTDPPMPASFSILRI